MSRPAATEPLAFVSTANLKAPPEADVGASSPWTCARTPVWSVCAPGCVKACAACPACVWVSPPPFAVWEPSQPTRKRPRRSRPLPAAFAVPSQRTQPVGYVTP